MIQTEYLKDGALIRHHSDSGLMLRQVETGREYTEAVDIVPCRYTYEETDKEILLSDGQALHIITGGAG